MFNLNRHALSTGIHGFIAQPFYPGPLTNPPAGIPFAAGHEDIQVPENTDFYLPAGTWVCIQNYEGDGWGLTLAFCPLGCKPSELMVYMHMNSVSPKIAVGQVYQGGMHLGKTGGIPGVAPGVSATDSSGAHLHFAYSFPVKTYVKKTYGKQAFAGAQIPWNYDQPLHIGGDTFIIGKTERL